MIVNIDDICNFRSARRLDSIVVSEILEISRRASEMLRQGHDVIVLAAGEPDFDTPDSIKLEANFAIQRGETKYTALDGTEALKRAVMAKFLRDNALSYTLDQITIGSGAKQVIYNAMMATLNPGDQVIIPTPYWVSYADIVRIAGGEPVFVPCKPQNGFRLGASDLEQAITKRTRWIILNSPSNPSGATYSEQDYAPILHVLLRHPQVWVLCDDMYEHIVYDNCRFATPASVEPSLKSRTLTVNGVSKCYAMTGWRIGYGGGPAELIEAIAKVQSQSTSCPSSVSQAAAVAALNGPQDSVEQQRDAFEKRRDFVLASLAGIAGLSCLPPQGAYYCFVDCSGVLGRRCPDGTVIASDADFCRYLLNAACVAVVPGSAFGLSPYFRLSFAASMTKLEAGLARIEEAVRVLAI